MDFLIVETVGPPEISDLPWWEEIGIRPGILSGMDCEFL
jgi:hypothetical protein